MLPVEVVVGAGSAFDNEVDFLVTINSAQVKPTAHASCGRKHGLGNLYILKKVSVPATDPSHPIEEDAVSLSGPHAFGSKRELQISNVFVARKNRSRSPSGKEGGSEQNAFRNPINDERVFTYAPAVGRETKDSPQQVAYETASPDTSESARHVFDIHEIH